MQFEKFVGDVYDEIDRREASSVWQEHDAGCEPAAFLPPHPLLSATRNQGRQKLARLTAADFDQLLGDVLRDARRRDVSLKEGRYQSRLASVVNMVSGLQEYDIL